jgi:hypothetical protein
LALGRLGWALRRIEQATGVRRETASAYLKAAGIAVRAPHGRRAPKPANGAEALTDYFPQKPTSEGVLGSAKPASSDEALTDSVASRPPTVSRCEAYRDVVELGLGRGRNAMAIWQELVDDHAYAGSYTSVRRYVRKMRGAETPQARAVIVTGPGDWR